MSKSKAKPITVDEARTLQIEHDDWIPLGERLSLSGTSKEALLELAKRVDVTYAVRYKIAEAPHADEEVLILLSQHTTHRWEWRALAAKYRNLYESFTTAFDEKEPFCEQMVSGHFGTPSLAAAYLLHTGGTMAEDFWHDLGTGGLIELDYVVDTFDGDHFGPLYDQNVGLEAGSAAEYLLTPGYSCTWISREPEADFGYVMEVVSEGPAEEFLSELYYQAVDDITKDAFSLLIGASIGLSKGHIHTDDEEKFGKLVTAWATEFDEEIVDQKVVIVGAPTINGARFQELSLEEIDVVVENLLTAHAHPLMQNLGITQHLLSLVLLHPLTSDALKARIIEAGKLREFQPKAN